MGPHPPGDRLIARYLDVLGVEAGPPGLELLTRIVTAQLTRAPFENISKLYLSRTRGAVSIPSLAAYLDGIEDWNLGGTCYANNYHLNTLLANLGFDVSLCGADMNNPDVHAVSMVRLQDREFLVDVGYGAPFHEPLPLDLEDDLVIDFGRCRYVLHPPDDAGCSRLDMWRDGRPIHGYLAKPTPRTIADFDTVIRDSYRPDATFMNTVVIERFSAEGSLRVHNLKLTDTVRTGGSTTAELRDLDELVETIEHRFGVPDRVIRSAVAGIDLSADIYS
jgi:arylamine N-acetyltransferase